MYVHVYIGTLSKYICLCIPMCTLNSYVHSFSCTYWLHLYVLVLLIYVRMYHSIPCTFFIQHSSVVICAHSLNCPAPGELLECKHQNEQLSVELSRARDELEVLKKHLQVACECTRCIAM